MARALRAWAINRGGKNSVRNLRYGPRTRLVRGIMYFVWLGSLVSSTEEGLSPERLVNQLLLTLGSAFSLIYQLVYEYCNSVVNQLLWPLLLQKQTKNDNWPFQNLSNLKKVQNVISRATYIIFSQKNL